jgi:cell division transport system ATP-binding protein
MTPTQGTITINNWNVVKLPGNKVPELRKRIGVVFQDLKLLPDRTIFENTSLPLELSGVKIKDSKKRVEEILQMVGIIEHANKFPIQLSGGERQRAAIARALILSPEILLADEPTGDLDDETAWEIVTLLKNINEAGGTTIIMATHNSDIIKKLNKRTIALNKGKVVEDKGGHKHKTEEAKPAEDAPAHHPHHEQKETKSMTDDFEEALKQK